MLFKKSLLILVGSLASLSFAKASIDFKNLSDKNHFEVKLSVTGAKCIKNLSFKGFDNLAIVDRQFSSNLTSEAPNNNTFTANLTLWPQKAGTYNLSVSMLVDKDKKTTTSQVVQLNITQQQIDELKKQQADADKKAKARAKKINDLFEKQYKAQQKLFDEMNKEMNEQFKEMNKLFDE